MRSYMIAIALMILAVQILVPPLHAEYYSFYPKWINLKYFYGWDDDYNHWIFSGNTDIVYLSDSSNYIYSYMLYMDSGEARWKYTVVVNTTGIDQSLLWWDFSVVDFTFVDPRIYGYSGTPQLFFRINDDIYGYIDYESGTMGVVCGSESYTYPYISDARRIYITFEYYSDYDRGIYHRARIFYQYGYDDIRFGCSVYKGIFTGGGWLTIYFNGSNAMVYDVEVDIRTPSPVDITLRPIHLHYFQSADDIDSWSLYGNHRLISVYDLFNSTRKLDYYFHHDYDLYRVLDYYFDYDFFIFYIPYVLYMDSGEAEWRHSIVFNGGGSGEYKLYTGILILDPKLYNSTFLTSLPTDPQPYVSGSSVSFMMSSSIYGSVSYVDRTISITCGSETYTHSFYGEIYEEISPGIFRYRFTDILILFTDQKPDIDSHLQIFIIYTNRSYSISSGYLANAVKDYYVVNHSCTAFRDLVRGGGTLRFRFDGSNSVIGSIELFINTMHGPAYTIATATTATTTTAASFPLILGTVRYSEMNRIFNLTISAANIVPPSGRLYTPSIVSPGSLLSFGMLLALFLYLSTKIRWTQSLFITSLLMSVMSFVVFMEPALFALSILLTLISLVLDRYM